MCLSINLTNYSVSLDSTSILASIITEKVVVLHIDECMFFIWERILFKKGIWFSSSISYSPALERVFISTNAGCFLLILTESRIMRIFIFFSLIRKQKIRVLNDTKNLSPDELLKCRCHTGWVKQGPIPQNTHSTSHFLESGEEYFHIKTLSLPVR